MANVNVVVIGGGPAGMIAAGFAAEKSSVVLVEKNEKLGKKLYITGKGRCNLTNASSPADCIENVAGNPDFLYSAFYGFSPDDTIAFFNSLGLKTKIERGNRVFPISDKASDVISALKKHLNKNNVEVKLNTQATDILISDGKICGVRTTNGVINTDSVIIATGGLSYPTTGSTGDGYIFAKAAKHTVTKLYPSLVSLTAEESFCRTLRGLSLKNVKLTIYDGEKALYENFGEMLFTDSGISGPLVLSASRAVLGKTERGRISAAIDLKPALTHEELSNRLIRDFGKYQNKNFINALSDLLPAALIPIITSLSEIPNEKKAHSVTKQEREGLVRLLKRFPLKINGTGGFNEAVITSGGVSVNEINPGTMESKLVKGLYFAGEVIDVDGYTGGFNLQIAFSTGFLAGNGAG